MKNFNWDNEVNKWRGICPRCQTSGFFDVIKEAHYAGVGVDIVACAGQHPFAVEYLQSDRNFVADQYPVLWEETVPDWVPNEYRSCYAEMLKADAHSMWRSVVALCSIMLDADVNTQIKNPGDTRKALGSRLEMLQKQGSISPDEFSDATITRLGRNEVIHPQDIANDISKDEAIEVLESTISYLERRHKWKASRALPDGENHNNNDDEV